MWWMRTNQKDQCEQVPSLSDIGICKGEKKSKYDSVIVNLEGWDKR